jgi:nucleotide-binding universal stress UspA family protein
MPRYERPPENVVVWFEATQAGRDALARARRIAKTDGAHLTVLAVATQEPVSGCPRCRQGAVIWNREMRAIGHEELLEAGRTLGPSCKAGYELAVGRPLTAIARAARECGADLIVLPSRRRSRLPRLRRKDLDERLRGLGAWRVSPTASRPTPTKSAARP